MAVLKIKLYVTLLSYQYALLMRLRELIDRIHVHEKKGGNKCYSQEITIYYRFVGLISIPMLPEDENYKADTRIGVEVEYIPRKSA